MMPKKTSLRRVAICASFFNAAFFSQIRDKAIHHRIVGPANECRRLPFLRDKSDQDELLQMMGQRRRRSAQARLKLSDGYSPLPDFHEKAINGKARRVTQRLEPRSCVIEFHKS
jgi:hypothetical protein